MAYASGIAGSPPDLNSQVNQLAQMALQSGDHMGFLQQYLSPSNPNRLAAQLAHGIVQQQMQGAQTQQNLNQPQPPTVLDGLEQQQGMAAMPTARGMFDPSVYTQGGIGAGLGEEDQGQTQMARGGVVAFADAGSVADKVAEYLAKNPTDVIANERVAAERYKPQFPEEGFVQPDTPEAKLAREARIQAAQERVAARAAADAAPTAGEVTRPMPTQPAEPAVAPTEAELKAAKKVTKLDSKIEKAVLKGKDTAKLIEQRQILTEGLNAGRPAPTVAPEGIASPGPTANPTVRAVTPGAAPATPPPAAAAGTAEAAAGAKESLFQRAKLTPTAGGLQTGRLGADPLLGKMGLGRAVVNRLGALAIPASIAYEVGDRLKGTSAARWMQDLVTPESPEEQAANLSLGQAPTRMGEVSTQSPVVQNVLWPAVLRQESGGKQFYTSGPNKGQVVTSPTGAVGIAQVQPTTGPEAAALAGLPWDEERLKTDEKYNNTLGQAYFNKQLGTFRGDTAKALAAYNAGPGATQKAINKAAKEGGDWRSYLPKETQQYIAAVQGGVNTRLGDIASAAPEKPAVARVKEMATGLPSTIQDKMTDGGTEGFFRGLTPQGFRAGLASLPAMGAGAIEALRGGVTPAAATPKTAQEQYADLQKTLASQQVPERAAAVPDEFMGMDRKTLQNFLWHSGAATLGGTNQYAGVNIGKGLMAGLSAKDTMEAKREAIAAKAEEGAQNRAEKQLEANLRSVGEDIKKALPNIDQFPGALTPLTNYAALAAMSPQQRRRVGYDDKLFAQLGRERDILMAQIKGGAGAATGGGNTMYNPTEAQQAALKKYT